jgi:hypothetical protein
MVCDLTPDRVLQTLWAYTREQDAPERALEDMNW